MNSRAGDLSGSHDEVEFNLDSVMSDLNLDEQGHRMGKDNAIDGELLRPGEGSHETVAEDVHDTPLPPEQEYEQMKSAHEDVGSSESAFQHRAQNFLSEFALALSGKSTQISRKKAFLMLAVVVIGVAFVFMIMAPNAPKPIHPLPADTGSTSTPAGQAPLVAVSAQPSAPGVATPNHGVNRDPSSDHGHAQALASQEPATNDSGSAAHTAGWKDTSQGLNDRVKRILMGDKGASSDTPEAPKSATIQDGVRVAAATTPPASVHGSPFGVPASALKQAAPAKTAGDSASASDLAGNARVIRMIEALTASVNALKKQQESQSGDVSDLTNKIGHIEGEIDVLTSQLAKTQVDQEQSKAEQAKTERPDLRVDDIALASGCDTCSAIAMATYEGQMLSLADGDSFLGFHVALKGNRVVLSKDGVTYSYVPKESSP